LAITPNGAQVYVTSFASNSVSVVDTATNTVLTAVAVGVGPSNVAITPGIGPPTNKDQCKKGGWKAFTVPGKFKNQGQCVNFANSRR
jgi:YVTN family beta-propeller protein